MVAGGGFRSRAQRPRQPDALPSLPTRTRPAQPGRFDRPGRLRRRQRRRESFFSLLQKNVLNSRCWATRDDLRIAIVTWIERTYHRRRRQKALGRLTPIEVGRRSLVGTRADLVEAVAREDLAEVDDGELVAAIARRDDAAMAEAVRRHRGPVLAFALRLVGDSGRAEEISQEVFLRLWERSSRFDLERGSLRSFLLAITHGRALDVLRSDTARVAREHRDAVRTVAPETGVEARVVAQTVADAVRQALAQLPDPDRNAVELAYFGGHSYRTVARMLNEPEGTVKSRIRRGLAKLRDLLAAQDLHGP